MQSIFGTDGIRGIFEQDLSFSLAQNIGYAFGRVIANNERVIIGRDTRVSGNLLLEALSNGLNSAGKEVIDIGICPTPAIPFLIKHFKNCTGIMISASHNPPEYNGIKIFDNNGNKINKSKERKIEIYLEKINQREVTKNPKENLKKFNYLEIYKKSLIDSVSQNNLNGIKIILDNCYGSATSCAGDIFKKLGAEVHMINQIADGSKINVNCGSTCLKPLKKAVYEKNADIGFSFDGDADRVMGIDSEGNILNGDHILFLWGRELLEDKKLSNNLLVSTVMANLGFENEWNKIGGILIRTQVGDKFIHQEIQKHNADLGGEQSGHILSNINNFSGDGILTAIQIANYCKQKNINLKDWLDSSFIAYPQKLTNIKLNSNDRNFKNLLENNVNQYIKEKLEKITEPCRIFARNSGTESVIRILVEAEDNNFVDNVSIEISKFVETLILK